MHCRVKDEVYRGVRLVTATIPASMPIAKTGSCRAWLHLLDIASAPVSKVLIIHFASTESLHALLSQHETALWECKALASDFILVNCETDA